MRQLIVIAHNLRSTHNIGSLLRTSEGMGVSRMWLTGYSPYPLLDEDDRLPHLAQKIAKQISKTALGAEQTLKWSRTTDIAALIADLKQQGYTIAAIEQAAKSTKLPDFVPPQKLVLIVGREVEGIEPAVLALCDQILEIPMFGSKESFNVVQAAAMALYHCRFYRSAR